MASAMTITSGLCMSLINIAALSWLSLMPERSSDDDISSRTPSWVKVMVHGGGGGLCDYSVTPVQIGLGF